MTIEDFKKSPRRVWINQPSTLQPYHEFHAMVGIGVLRNSKAGPYVSIHFVEGELHSLPIDPKYLALK